MTNTRDDATPASEPNERPAYRIGGGEISGPVFHLSDVRLARRNEDGTYTEIGPLPQVIHPNTGEFWFKGEVDKPFAFNLSHPIQWTFTFMTGEQFKSLRSMLEPRTYSPKVLHNIRRRIERNAKRAARGYGEVK